MSFTTTTKREQARRALAKRVQAGEPCALCRQPIDLDLRYPHDQSFVVDHIKPSSRGGTDELSNLQPSHSACNLARSDSPAGTLRSNSGALD